MNITVIYISTAVRQKYPKTLMDPLILLLMPMLSWKATDLDILVLPSSPLALSPALTLWFYQMLIVPEPEHI